MRSMSRTIPKVSLSHLLELDQADEREVHEHIVRMIQFVTEVLLKAELLVSSVHT